MIKGIKFRREYYVKPHKKRYKKHCVKCGKRYVCNGTCGKEESSKNSLTACYCAKCFRETLGYPQEYENCPTRFGKQAEPKLIKASKGKLITKEKVVFT